MQKNKRDGDSCIRVIGLKNMDKNEVYDCFFFPHARDQEREADKEWQC